MSVKVTHMNSTLYGLKQTSQSWRIPLILNLSHIFILGVSPTHMYFVPKARVA